MEYKHWDVVPRRDPIFIQENEEISMYLLMSEPDEEKLRRERPSENEEVLSAAARMCGNFTDKPYPLFEAP